MTIMEFLSGEKNEQEQYWPQIMVTGIACLCSLNSGLLFAWSSPFIVKIVSDNVTYHISESEAVNFAIIPTLTMIVFCSVFAFLYDLIGRRRTLLLIVIPGATAWIIKAFAKEAITFYIARAFVGIESACFYVLFFLYLGEVTSPIVRGTLTSVAITCYYIGVFLINVLGSYFDVTTTSYICLPVPILFFILFWFMPESPYYYIMNGEYGDAKRSLWFLRRKTNIEDDFLKLKADVDRQQSERGSWKDIILIKSNRKALALALFLRFSQFMGGISVFTTSIQFVFDKAPAIVPSSTAAMIYSSFTCIALLGASSIADKIGRRTAYTSSLFFSGTVLFSQSLFFYMVDFHTELDLSSLNWFPLISQNLFILMASFGPGIVPSLMISEIFSTTIKAKANIISILMLAFLASLTNYVFYALFPITGLSGSYLLFATMNYLSAIISHLYLPETSGKSLEAIQQLLKGVELNPIAR